MIDRALEQDRLAVCEERIEALDASRGDGGDWGQSIQRIAGVYGRRCAHADLSAPAEMQVIASITELKSGESLPHHSHHGIETGYVLQGSLVKFPGQAPVLLATGTSSATMASTWSPGRSPRRMNARRLRPG